MVTALRMLVLIYERRRERGYVKFDDTKRGEEQEIAG
jgi:hypothetical protein